jgi:hypothetical protein
MPNRRAHLVIHLDDGEREQIGRLSRDVAELRNAIERAPRPRAAPMMLSTRGSTSIDSSSVEEIAARVAAPLEDTDRSPRQVTSPAVAAAQPSPDRQREL